MAYAKSVSYTHLADGSAIKPIRNIPANKLSPVTQLNLLRLLPRFIRQKVEHRAGLGRILGNVAWLSMDKVIRMGLGLTVGVWLARYLGPDQFGQLNYAIAFAGLFGTLAGLGLNSIVVRDIVQDPDTANVTLGTAFFLQFLGGVIAVPLIVVAIAWLRPDDALTKAMVSVLGLGLIFKSTEVVKYWFESRIQVRYTVWIENAAFLVMTGIRIAMILQQASLMAFVWITLAEAVAVSIGLLVIHAKVGGQMDVWRPRLQRAWSLLADSWPLLLSGLAIFLFMRVDLLMIGLLAGDREMGIYTAALRLSEPWYFLPTVIASSVFPLIARSATENAKDYHAKLSRMLRLAIWLHVAISLLIMFGANYIVEYLFSAPYRESAPILALHVWTGVFQAMGIISGQWMVYEGLVMLALLRNVCGAVVSLAMNVILIPKFGGIGAAVSALSSVVFAYYLFDFLSPRTRPMFWLKTRAMLLWGKHGPLR